MALGVLALPAFAILAVATPAAAETWSGPYVGAAVGGVRIENASSPSAIVTIPIPPEFFGTTEGDGASIGAIAGYRWRVGGAVVGLEADLDVLDVAAGRSSALAALNVDARWTGSVRVVIGAPIRSALVYGGVGLATTELEYGYRHGSGAPANFTETASGWTHALGVEWSAGRVHPRIEYRMTNPGKFERDAASFSFVQDATTSSVRFALIAPLGVAR